jgi:serine/threonine protein kinase/Tfp pilus assembly protein PilF
MKCPKCQAENPETKQFCGDCGTQLPPPQGHPPLVTETLQTPIRELTTGSTFAGRYQVIEELGHGGMGRVYKVFDTKIKEKVALKLIKPEIASDKEVIERFGNELRLARNISQRNVCRMFDMGEAEGAHFITMEYVHGEDLKSMIHMSGSLSVGMLLSVGKQVCDGLAEAHSLGVVHRDLKPQNIMIDKNGNAKIMDFGIARSVRDKGITGAGVMIGTPEYMSPEQAEAEEVDQRSDIYSLGVILYEMATSHVPFTGETALSIAMKHQGETPKDPKQLNPGIPDDLSGVILKCLAKDKEKRYQTASDLRSELDKIEKGIPTTERVVPEIKPLTSREITLKFTPKKFFLPGLVFLALIAAGIVLWRVLPSKTAGPAPSVSGMPTLAVLYFENKSGDTKLDTWRDMLSELLITSLSQSRYIRVITGEEMYTILKRLGLADARKYSSEDIERVAAQTRATHVLRGSFIKAGQNFIITAGLQKPGTRENPPPLQIEAKNDEDVIVKVNELTRQVKEGLNLTADQMASDVEKDVALVTTSSPEALKYYVEGRRHYLKGESKETLAYMQKAVEIDPEFAMAYRTMAIANRYDDPVGSRKYLKKALELSDRLSEYERLRIEFDQFNFDEDYIKAREVAERLIKAYPQDTIGHWCLYIVYCAAGEWDKAIEQYEPVVKILRTPMTVGNLAESYNAAGLYQKAEDLCRLFLQEVEDNQRIRGVLRYSYLCRRQFDLAFAEAEKLAFSHPDDLGCKYDMGDVLLLKGDIAGAEKIYQQIYQKTLVVPEGAFYKLTLIHGKYSEALRLNQQWLDYAKGHNDTPGMLGSLGGLIDISIKCGRLEDAKKFFAQQLQARADARQSQIKSGLPYLPSEQRGDLYDKGLTQARLGSFDEARKTAEELKALIDKGINATDTWNYEHILGTIEVGKSDFRKASGFFEEACGRLAKVNFEGDARFFDGLAHALYESGDLNKARQEYEKITLQTTGRLDFGDLYAKAFHMLGKIAEQQGDKVKAREDYQKFLDLWKDADAGLPEVADAKKRLAAL